MVDSEFSTLMSDVNAAVDMQAVLKSHRNFLVNLSKMSFIDNVSIQENLDRILQVCLRFLSIYHLIQLEETGNDDVALDDSFALNTINEGRSTASRSSTGLGNLMTSFLTSDSASLNQSMASRNWHKLPLVIPVEELDAVRKEFFKEVSFLFQLMGKLDNKGFMFRLDFNGYLSQGVTDHRADQQMNISSHGS